MEIKNYRDLRVWQSGMDLVVMVYEISEKFPSKEMYGLTSQVRRAAVSPYTWWLSSSECSLRDVSKPPVNKAILVIRLLLKFVGFDTVAEEHRHLLNQRSITKQLYALRNALQSKK